MLSNTNNSLHRHSHLLYDQEAMMYYKQHSIQNVKQDLVSLAFMWLFLE
jgi:hypothetical protein